MRSLARPRLIVAALASLSFIAVASASHSWGGYHWARTANPFTLKLGDNLTANWDPYLVTTSADWTLSSVLDTVIVPGTTNPKVCKAKSGRIEVCNAKYGNNGWLGIAQIWISGSHITQAVTKMNDTYFNTATYNTPAWRNLVLCQEVGHGFGLDHQDENFGNANLGTCMDYTNDPSTNQHPNAHDYEQLELIYAHLDSVNTFDSSPEGGDGGGSGGKGRNRQEADLSHPSEWGRAIHQSGDGRHSAFERDLGKGHKVFTFVIWADEERDGRGQH